MKKVEEKAKEIGESFVNGNIAWVKKQVTNIKTYQAVMDFLEEYDVKIMHDFKRLIGRG